MKLLLLFCLKGIFLSSENTPIVRVLHRSFEEPSALADERCLQAGFSSFHLTVLKRRRRDEIKLKLKKLHFSSTRSCSVTFFLRCSSVPTCTSNFQLWVGTMPAVRGTPTFPLRLGLRKCFYILQIVSIYPDANKSTLS